MNNIKHIEINIWKACNNKCRFCMSASVWLYEKEITKKEWVKQEIEKYSVLWYNSIWFLWWDISIHPHIYEIIWEAKNNWFKQINVITNAMIFSHFGKAEKLVKSWVTRVNISIHSHNSETEDYITQIPWGFERKLQAIDNFNILYKHWFLQSPLSINIVLNKINNQDILKTCLFFYTVKKIKDIRINFLWNRFFFSEKDKQDLELSYTDFLPHLKNLIIFSLKSDLRITFDSVPACIFYKLWFKNSEYIAEKFIWEDKDHIEEISNINQNRYFDWKDQKTNELKIKFDNCKNCLYYNGCQWIWKEYVDRFWNKEFNSIIKL